MVIYPGENDEKPWEKGYLTKNKIGMSWNL
jgi:hypothetical protein